MTRRRCLWEAEHHGRRMLFLEESCSPQGGQEAEREGEWDEIIFAETVPKGLLLPTRLHL
jgi:hypothetical protein